MTLSTPGATPKEWFHFDLALGLGANLLPCVPAHEGVKVAEGSSLEGKVGKIPSAYNRDGEAHGLKDWPNRLVMENEVALWSKSGLYNCCIRTGPISKVYAIDVDCENSDDISESIFSQLFILGIDPARVSKRTRGNSGKFLIPFLMEEPCKKKVIKLDNEPKGPRIELLADGQQFLAAGSHSSGARYQWVPGLPNELPRLRLAQVEKLWNALALAVGQTAPPSNLETSLPSTTSDTALLTSIGEDQWGQLRSALRFLTDKVPDNDTWSEIGYALLSIQKTRPAKQLFLEWSRKTVGWEEGAPEAWWIAHAEASPRSDFRHIFSIATGLGWSYTAPPDAFSVLPMVSGDDEDTLPPQLEKPLIRVVDAELPNNIRQIEELIEPDVYLQGNVHVRLTRDHNNDEIRRNADQTSLVLVTPGWLRVHTTQRAQFQRFDGRSETWKDSSCPTDLALTALGQGDSQILRPLEAIARAPFVRADGSICNVAGYDPRSRALYMPSMDYPPIPTNPTMVDAARALEHLLTPFAQFPYVSPIATATFASHILTEVARLAIDRAPMYWYTAPDAGTGKTLLSEMAAIIVHGIEPAVRPWVQEGDELRKTLFASLLAGDRSISFDNVPTGFKARSPELCAFLTSAVWKDRKLGVSETHAVRNRAVVSASGNNVTPVSDMARRSLVIRLDANSTSLKSRKFTIVDLRAWVLKNRAQLLIDALVIILAYYQSKPMELTPLPSFERWTQMCCAPLLWLGMADPRESQDLETDDETGGAEFVFARLYSYFNDRPFTAFDVAKMAGSIQDSDGELVALFMSAGCPEPNSPIKVGYWLRERRDQLAGGYKMIQAAGKDRIGVRWQLQPTGSKGLE